MRRQPSSRLPVGLLALLLPLAACREAYVLHRALRPPAQLAELDQTAPYFKAHLRDGDLLVFDRWVLDQAGGSLVGHACRLDADRRPRGCADTRLPLDSIVLGETNSLEAFPGVATLRHLTTANAVLGGVISGSLVVLCATNPKACFGSCPTFYTLDGGAPVLQAEGFSASVAPSLEAPDLDAFCRPHLLPPDFFLEMRNEALETHHVRRADLLLVPCPPDGEVLKDGAGDFWSGRAPAPATASPQLDAAALAALALADGLEWGEPADGGDLGAARVVELAFPRPTLAAGERPGLALCGRQSLLTTFLFYQALDWAGSRAGVLLASLERGQWSWDGSLGRLSDIRVRWRDGSGRWREAAHLNETGPLALDEHVVPLPVEAAAGAGPLWIRLEVVQGSWRLDRAALLALRPAPPARRLAPVEAARGGVPDPAALAALSDPARLLVTEPGDTWRLRYQVPPELAQAAAFLDCQGWYLEWMREDWLRQDEPERLAALFRHPRRVLRELAPEFKALEPDLDSLFWNSRYAN